MLQDTSFIYYEKLGLERFYGSIARIGVIDRESSQKINGEWVKTSTRALLITDLEEISGDNLMNIKLSHWSIESQHWVLDVILNEDKKTARMGNAVSNGSMMRRFCLTMKKYDPELKDKQTKRFLMHNEHDIMKIEELLFGKVAN